jgi:ATP phosphoribosyltransferase regulatory subunit
MADRIPSGTRDVLPDEMREVRAMTDRIRSVFDGAGYGEISTPTLEFERTFQRDGHEDAYRLFDEFGQVLVLRADMTVPIARVVGSRYANAELPLRFCYVEHAYRGVRPGRGHARELLQAGVELIGPTGAAGTAEALTVLCDALTEIGLQEFRVGLGDVRLYPALLDSSGVPERSRDAVIEKLAGGDFVGVRRELAELPLASADAELLLRVPRMRGGPEILDTVSDRLSDAGSGLRETLALLPERAAERVILDLGLVRNLEYYTGAIFQVYDPAHGTPLGSGGRYDDLLSEFGRSLPAVGFALDVDRLHAASRGEERSRA